MIGFVYKIWNDVDDKFYIGSTVQGLNARFQGHKDKHKIETIKNYNCSLFKHYRELGFDKFHIQCLETYEYEDLKDLRLKEQEYCNNLKPVLNSQRASRANMTKKEIYKEGNDKAISNRTPDQVEHHKQRVKKWHTENKEKVKKYKAELFQRKKAELQAKAAASPQVTCECGSMFKQMNKSVHIKSVKHKNWLAIQ